MQIEVTNEDRIDRGNLVFIKNFLENSLDRKNNHM